MKLAIKGHATRGKEIIQLLKMLGGKNKYNLWGNAVYSYYVIEHGEIIGGEYISSNEPYTFFTLEEFEEKFPYKVGDCVSSKYCKNYKIEKEVWDSRYNKVIYKLQGMGWYNVEELQPYKEETMEERKYADLRLDVDQDDKLATEVTINGDKITPPENYLIGKITKVDNGMLVEFVKKQSQYLKTYKECYDVLGIDTQFCMKYLHHGTFSYKEKIIYNMQELLICRDAYWKVAGEQMGLEKPWKPDWCNENKLKYCIECSFGTIDKTVSIVNGCLLAFPTKEMRDAFYENFRELIEQCKELL